MDDEDTCSEESAPSSITKDPIPTIVNQLVEHVGLIRKLTDEIKEIRQGLLFTNESIGQLRGQFNKLQSQIQELLIPPPETEYEMLHGDDI